MSKGFGKKALLQNKKGSTKSSHNNSPNKFGITSSSSATTGDDDKLMVKFVFEGEKFHARTPICFDQLVLSDLLNKVSLDITLPPPTAQELFELYFKEDIYPYIRHNIQSQIRNKRDITKLWELQSNILQNIYEKRAKLLLKEWKNRRQQKNNAIKSIAKDQNELDAERKKEELKAKNKEKKKNWQQLIAMQIASGQFDDAPLHKKEKDAKNNGNSQKKKNNKKDHKKEKQKIKPKKKKLKKWKDKKEKKIEEIWPVNNDKGINKKTPKISSVAQHLKNIKNGQQNENPSTLMMNDLNNLNVNENENELTTETEKSDNLSTDNTEINNNGHNMKQMQQKVMNGNMNGNVNVHNNNNNNNRKQEKIANIFKSRKKNDNDNNNGHIMHEYEYKQEFNQSVSNNNHYQKLHNNVNRNNGIMNVMNGMNGMNINSGYKHKIAPSSSSFSSPIRPSIPPVSNVNAKLIKSELKWKMLIRSEHKKHLISDENDEKQIEQIKPFINNLSNRNPLQYIKIWIYIQSNCKYNINQGEIWLNTDQDGVLLSINNELTLFQTFWSDLVGINIKNRINSSNINVTFIKNVNALKLKIPILSLS